MRRGGAVLVALVTACGVDLPLRDDVTYTCNTNADCPLKLTCATLAHECVAELDTTPPRLTSITATDRETVVFVFDEAVDRELAAQLTTFTLTRDDGQALSVRAAGAPGDGKSIVVRTGRQRGAAVYAVTTSITDQQGNPAALDVDSFTGFGPSPDQEPPTVTSPTNASVIVVPEAERAAPTVTLAWTARSGAIDYIIELSSTETFSTIDTTITVPAEETTHVLPVAEGRSYFWRVRSDASTPGAYGRGLFTVLFDTIYVSCPASQAACRSGDGIGSKNVPLAAVSRAVALAADREVANIAIASRGGPAAYHEPLGITGGGLTLRGGYTADFSGTTSDATVVAYEGAVLTIVQTSEPLVIDRLVLRAIPDAAAPTSSLNVVGIQGADANVTFTDSVLETADLDGSTNGGVALPFDTTAVGVVGGTGSVILGPGTTTFAGEAFRAATAVAAVNAHLVVNGATLTAKRVYGVTSESQSTALQILLGTFDVDGMAASAFSQGVQVAGAVGEIRDSSVVVKGTGRVTAVFLLLGSLARLEGNRLIASTTGPSTTGISTASATQSVIANNTVVVAGATNLTGIGIPIGRPLLVNNTIVLAGDAPTSSAIVVAKETFPDIANTLIVCLPGAGTSTGILEEDTFGDPLAIVSNVLIGCDVPYRDAPGTNVSDLDTLNGQTLDCSGCGLSRASSNATLASVDPFVSLLGVDGLLDTPDNNLDLATSDPLIVAGGVDTASASCGSSAMPNSCGALTTDLVHRSRTAPTSVGAYEKD